jgi:N-acetylmuramoyl-L-alanine amidase
VGWTLVQDWGTSNTFTWQPATPSPLYRAGVGVRNASTTTDTTEASTEVPFPITALGPLQVGLTANQQPPQPVGTATTFIAVATGGLGVYQYKWLIFDGTAWTTLQDWSTSNTFTWQPSTPNPLYEVGVSVRNSSTTTDILETSTQVPFPITP